MVLKLQLPKYQKGLEERLVLRLQLQKYQKGLDKAMVWSLQLHKYQKGLDRTRTIKEIKACIAKVPKRLRQNQQKPKKNKTPRSMGWPAQASQPMELDVWIF